MKGLPTLIKMHQRELDELRRQLVEQQKVLEALMAEAKRLADERDREQQMASDFPEMAGFYGTFAKSIEEKQAEIREKSRQVNQLIRKTQEKITDAFGELKRLEITRDSIAAAEQAERDKIEQAAMDELGLQGFVRKQLE
jgi:flagellar export protein FliJ